MPELPEVETIRTQLSEHLPFKIKKVNYSPVVGSLFGEKSFDPEGMEISEIKRYGKVLNFILGDQHILSGLGMTGGWIISKESLDEKHKHVEFICDDIYLSYVDPRRFGFIHYMDESGKENFLTRLGPDPFSKDFNAEYIYSVLKKYPNRQLKPFLLDQKYFAGIGNYLASEICALAGVRPTRRAGKVTKKEAGKLKEATDAILNKSIKANGATFWGGYRDTSGEKGDGLNHLVVFFQRDCGMCGGVVKKIILGGRGTFYCPKCQK
ncbi:MAG: Fpg/Nei family DNA glycosylase [Deltaproteobacteria bacterium]|nr:MAG: Fpg/Nei family DNA glycosylase [Deltaproteobacteria bacterium]